MAGGQNTVISDTAEKCRLLNSLGINVNLGPVCDVARSEKDYIFPRCWSTDPLQAAAAVKTIVSEMTRNRTGAVLKHFPGYGNNLDTHTGTARDSRPYSEFERIDFLPFRTGISQGAGAVMVAHNVVECMDKTLPRFSFSCSSSHPETGIWLSWCHHHQRFGYEGYPRFFQIGKSRCAGCSGRK